LLHRHASDLQHPSIGQQTGVAVIGHVACFVAAHYGSATLTGLPRHQLDRLQAVLNAAARLIFLARQRDHVMPLLMYLHWLRVPERITFCLAVLVYRCLHGLGSRYLARNLRRVADVSLRSGLRTAT
jgi:hypothetical protein